MCVLRGCMYLGRSIIITNSTSWRFLGKLCGFVSGNKTEGGMGRETFIPGLLKPRVDIAVKSSYRLRKIHWTTESRWPPTNSLYLTKYFDNFPPESGCSEGLDAFRFFLNGGPNRDKILARSNQSRTPEPYRRQDDVFGYELQFLLLYLYLYLECCQYYNFRI